MCLYPNLVKNPKYKANKKNGGVIPAISDKRVLYVPIGCTKCIECKKQKANQWRTRMLEDIKVNKNGKFIGLSFTNKALEEIEKEAPNIKGYELDNWVATRAVRLWLERWRKKYGKSLRHWLVTEIGGTNTERIHLHGIVWTDNEKDIHNTWGYGRTFVGGYVNDRSVNYIVKYVTKTDVKHPNYNGIILTSPGIGANYVNTYNARLNKFVPNGTNDVYITRNGTKSSLPIYYKNKLYTEEEREKMWLEKLDKQERYVLGAKIDISKGDEKYFSAVLHAREKNVRLGYGNRMKNIEQIEYEATLRELRRLERTVRVDKNIEAEKERLSKLIDEIDSKIIASGGVNQKEFGFNRESVKYKTA